MNALTFDPGPILALDLSTAGVVTIAAAVGLIGWVAGFVPGFVLGRRSEVQRRVDAVLRRETRPRHPAGRSEKRMAPESLAEATGVLRSVRTPIGDAWAVSDADRRAGS